MSLLHASPTAGYVTTLRCLVFGMWAAKFAVDPLQELAGLPQSAYWPPTPLSWLSRETDLLMVSYGALLALRLAGIASALACLSSGLLRSAAPICCLLATIDQATLRGFGHVNHAEILLLLASYVFCLSAWTSQKGQHPEPLLITLLMLVTYMLTGIHRVAVGGLEVFASDSIVFWSIENASRISAFNFGGGVWLGDHPVFWLPMKVSFAAITLIEILGPLALLSSSFRRFYLVAMVGFHIGVALTMNIIFWENAVLLVVLLGGNLVPRGEAPLGIGGSMNEAGRAV